MQSQPVNIKPKVIVRPLAQPVNIRPVIKPRTEPEYMPLSFPRQIKAKYGVGPSEDGYTLQANRVYTATERHKEYYIVIKMGKDEVAWKYKHFEELTR